MNWDDLRYGLAIKRGGTLSAAARELGVNQTTVSRRLERLEAVLGVRMFDRIDGTMIATPEGDAALARIARMEEDALSLHHHARAEEETPSGTVRFTSLQAIVANFVAPNLGDFLARFPAVTVELVSAAANLNLSRREADLALRLSRPQSGDFLARKVGEIGYAVYGARGRFTPADEGALGAQPWFVYDDAWAHLPEALWVRDKVKPSQVLCTATDVVTLAELVKSGTGIAVLPCVMGDAAPALHRLSGRAPVCTRELWLLSHPENKGVKRIAAFAGWLVALIKDSRGRLAST